MEFAEIVIRQRISCHRWNTNNINHNPDQRELWRKTDINNIKAHRIFLPAKLHVLSREVDYVALGERCQGIVTLSIALSFCWGKSFDFEHHKCCNAIRHYLVMPLMGSAQNWWRVTHQRLLQIVRTVYPLKVPKNTLGGQN